MALSRNPAEDILEPIAQRAIEQAGILPGCAPAALQCGRKIAIRLGMAGLKEIGHEELRDALHDRILDSLRSSWSDRPIMNP